MILTPCHTDDRDIISRARRALIDARITEPALVAVVAPTFDGVKVIAFGDREISVLSFKAKGGYSAPESWFQEQGSDNLKLAISPAQQYSIAAPLIRQARYASTTPRSGNDGTIYFLDWGGECAFTWSPNEDDGPSAFVAQMLEEIQSTNPSVLKLRQIASDMDAQDRRGGR